MDHADYELSRPTENYDEFLSHDWGTSRWLKLVSMLIFGEVLARFFLGIRLGEP